MKFTKMNGLGNDYIFINYDNERVGNPSELSKKLTDGHRAVGGDGIVLVSMCDEADLAMRIFNADGSEGLMCGNALRCIGKYAYENLDLKKECFSVKTASGIKTVKLKTESGNVARATANLGKITGYPTMDTVLYDGIYYTGYRVSVGNPHFVVFVDDFPQNFSEVGKYLSENVLFENGTNVEFVLKDVREGTINVRVYERGSGETMSCGTGAAASFYICRMLELVPDSATVCLPGGNLLCEFVDGCYEISGTVEKNFEGEINI